MCFVIGMVCDFPLIVVLEPAKKKGNSNLVCNRIKRKSAGGLSNINGIHYLMQMTWQILSDCKK